IKKSSIGCLVDCDPHLRGLALSYAKPACLVPYCYQGVEACHFARVGLLLDNTNVHNLALHVRQEVFDYFGFLYPHAILVDLVHRVYLACQHHASKRGSRLPFNLLLLTWRVTTHFFLLLPPLAVSFFSFPFSSFAFFFSVDLLSFFSFFSFFAGVAFFSSSSSLAESVGDSLSASAVGFSIGLPEIL